MSTSEPRPVSAGLVTAVYTGVTVAGAVFIYAVIWALETFFNITFQNSAMGIILVFCAASAAGQFWYSREQQKPASGRVWKVSVLCAFVSVLLQGLIIGAIIALVGMDAAIGTISAADRQILMIAAVVIALLEILVVRLGFWMGIKQAAKQAALRAAKAGS
jgi:hypothetical protein